MSEGGAGGWRLGRITPDHSPLRSRVVGLHRQITCQVGGKPSCRKDGKPGRDSRRTRAIRRLRPAQRQPTNGPDLLESAGADILIYIGMYIFHPRRRGGAPMAHGCRQKGTEAPPPPSRTPFSFRGLVRAAGSSGGRELRNSFFFPRERERERERDETLADVCTPLPKRRMNGRKPYRGYIHSCSGIFLLFSSFFFFPC